MNIKLNRLTIAIIVLLPILIFVWYFKYKCSLYENGNYISDIKIEVADIKNGKKIIALGPTSITFFLHIAHDKELISEMLKNRKMKVILKIPDGFDTTFGHSISLRNDINGEFQVFDDTMLFSDAEPEQIAVFEGIFRKQAVITLKDESHQWVFSCCQ